MYVPDIAENEAIQKMEFIMKGKDKAAAEKARADLAMLKYVKGQLGEVEGIEPGGF